MITTPVRRTLVTLAALLLPAGTNAQGAHAPPQPELQSEPRPVGTLAFGAYTHGAVWHGMEPILTLEAQLGRTLDIVHWFTNWDAPYQPHMVAAVLEGGRRPLISWEPTHRTVASIAAGEHDAYLREWARGVRTTAELVYVRPFPEMNGDWTPWSGDPEALRAAWRRMAAIFDAEGARNVRWVFSPNVTDSPRTHANRMEAYYPGSDVVDVLALDAYNWGTTRPWSQWVSFEDLFRGGYARITQLGPQPVWFAEMASASQGGDKAAWVASMFASTAFPRLEALVWFDENKEADWRAAADPAVLDAFRAGLGTRSLLATVP